MNDDHALVLFSGGQDSTTCLAWALARYPHVETIGFAYGQRHAVELDCRAPIREAVAAKWRGRLGPDHMVDLSATLDSGRRPCPAHLASGSAVPGGAPSFVEG